MCHDRQRRLNLKDQFIIVEDDVPCAQTEGTIRRRNLNSPYRRCRIVSRSGPRATGHDLYHNKIKKWINRRYEVENSFLQFYEELFESDNNYNFYSNNNLMLSLDDETPIMLVFILFLECALHFDTKRDALQDLIFLLASSPTNKEDLIERYLDFGRFDNLGEKLIELASFFTNKKLVKTTKSAGRQCKKTSPASETVRINGFRNRCVMAYRNSLPISGPAFYTEQLLDELNQTSELRVIADNPILIFFDKTQHQNFMAALRDVRGHLETINTIANRLGISGGRLRKLTRGQFSRLYNYSVENNSNLFLNDYGEYYEESGSPGRSRSPSPGRSRSPSPGRSRSPSPGRSRSPSPGRSRSPSPGRGSSDSDFELDYSSQYESGSVDYSDADVVHELDLSDLLGSPGLPPYVSPRRPPVTRRRLQRASATRTLWVEPVSRRTRSSNRKASLRKRTKR